MTVTVFLFRNSSNKGYGHLVLSYHNAPLSNKRKTKLLKVPFTLNPPKKVKEHSLWYLIYSINSVHDAAKFFTSFFYANKKLGARSTIPTIDTYGAIETKLPKNSLNFLTISRSSLL